MTPGEAAVLFVVAAVVGLLAFLAGRWSSQRELGSTERDRNDAWNRAIALQEDLRVERNAHDMTKRFLKAADEKVETLERCAEASK